MGVNTSKEVLESFQTIETDAEELIQELYKGKHLTKSYAMYRPHYPKELFEEILTYHDKSELCGHHLAVDVCCGSGQSTLPLVKIFEKIVGVDVSKDQIDHMPKDITNLETYVAKAEHISMIMSGTVDLVTIATGLHWINFKKFFEEVKRILKPGGTIAVYSWLFDNSTDPKVGEYLSEALCVLKSQKYLKSNVLLTCNKYQSIEFPFENLTRFEMEKQFELTIDHFKGYLYSLSMVSLYYKDHPGTKLVEEIGDRLEKMLNPEGRDDIDVKLKLTRPVFLILGRNNS